VSISRIELNTLASEGEEVDDVEETAGGPSTFNSEPKEAIGNGEREEERRRRGGGEERRGGEEGRGRMSLHSKIC
jgi:hypothetical protein